MVVVERGTKFEDWVVLSGFEENFWDRKCGGPVEEEVEEEEEEWFRRC